MIAIFATYDGSTKHKSFIYPTNLKEFYALEYKDSYVEMLLKQLKLQKQNITKILLKKFMKFVELDIKAEQISTIYPDLPPSYKKPGYLKSTIQEYIELILSTNSGKLLICSLLSLMEQKKGHILFQLAEKNEGITYEPFKKDEDDDEENKLNENNAVIKLDLDPLLSSTDFYIYNPGEFRLKVETKILPDVYLFHELLHYKHALEDKTTYDALNEGVIPEKFSYHSDIISTLSKDFPGNDDINVDYEDMRTIIGFPFNNKECRYIVCENSYRFERGLPDRMNLLDASKQKASLDNLEKIQQLVEESKSYFPVQL